MTTRGLQITAGVLTLILGLLYFQRTRVLDPAAPPGFTAMGPFAVEYVRVIQGHEFDLKLDNGQRIHGVLAIKTAPEAKVAVIRLLNSCSSPEAVILDKVGDSWLVDIHFVLPDAERKVSLTEWLKSNRLAWDDH